MPWLALPDIRLAKPYNPVPVYAPATSSASLLDAPGQWLTARRCRIILLIVLLATFAGHLLYLTCDSPLDLAEDEAYYWDWSRQLDISFYSKGPVTPALIRLSCAVFGDSMPAVRLPALFMRLGLTLCFWWLARRLFGSERLALLAVLLSYVVPMLLAAGLVMTTDPPFLFLWGLATCLGAAAIFDSRRWAWVALGPAVGVGFLTKFSMPLWLAGMFLFLMLDRASRGQLKRRWPWLSILIFLPFTIPVLLWNSRHGWVTFLHVQEDIGIDKDGQFVLQNAIEFWTGQLGVVGPLMFLLMVAAVVHAVRAIRRNDPQRRAMLFLLCMSLPVFLLVMLSSFRKHAAANWCASSYFALLVLTAHFIYSVRQHPARWRFWRWLFWPAIVSGLAINIIAHETQVLYPLIARFNARVPQRALDVQKIDPTHRLHGWRAACDQIQPLVDAMKSPALVMSSDYQTTAELAFYLRGHPVTYCAGSYFNTADREPFSQYDILARPPPRSPPPRRDRTVRPGCHLHRADQSRNCRCVPDG